MRTERRKETAALTKYLRSARRRILLAWHRRVCRDPKLVTAKALSFAQFTDSMPRVLDAFEELLAGAAPRSQRAALRKHREGAIDHGLNRWQQGFTLREIVREWGHMHYCLLVCLDKYAARHRRQALLVRRARHTAAVTCAEGISESIQCYAHLKEEEASGRMRDLLSAVAALQKAAQIRTEVLRQAAHDLRGSMSIISNVTGSLGRPATVELREDLRRTLDRAVTATSTLLTELLDLTRLEAGDDELELREFDASALLRELGETLRIESAAHGLFLRLEGPEPLTVTGDPTKLKRIVQNLVLNAIKATRDGGVTVRWKLAAHNTDQWQLEVIDTGQGLGASHASPIIEALLKATELRRVRQSEVVRGADASAFGSQTASPPAAPSASHSGPHTPSLGGEGIGLAIVKRLCDLLGAGIEVEPAHPTGIVFRIEFPRIVRPPAAA